MKDGNSEMGVHKCSDLGNLICVRHLFRSLARTIFVLYDFFKKTYATCSELPSDISTMGKGREEMIVGKRMNSFCFPYYFKANVYKGGLIG